MRIHRESLIIAIVLIIGFIIRMIGIRHGFPGIYHPDEPIAVSRAVNAVINNDWNPEFFHWPSLLIYILAIEYYIIWLSGYISGRFADLTQFLEFYMLNPDVFHYWGRTLIALMGVGSAYFIYATVRLWLDRIPAFIVLVITLFTPLIVKHSLYITPDVPAFFISTIVIYMLARYWFAGRQSRAILTAAAFAGVAAAFKYNYGLLILPVIFLIFTSPEIKLIRKAQLTLYSALLCMLFFLVLNPYIILDFEAFKFQFREISFHLREGHIGMETRNPIRDLISHTINGTGIILFFVSIIGFIMTLRRHVHWAVAIAIFPMIILFSHSAWPVISDRYAVPLVLFVLLFSAPVLHAAVRSHPIFKPFFIVVFGVMLLQPALASAQILNHHTKPDTREVAKQWITENIPARSKLVLERDGPYLRNHDALRIHYKEPAYYIEEIMPWYGTHFRTPETPLDMIVSLEPEYVVINSGVYSRYAPGAPSERDFPEIHAVWRNYYDKLEQFGELVHEIQPSNEMVGPIVKIYKIPDEIYNRIIAIPSGSQ